MRRAMCEHILTWFHNSKSLASHFTMENPPHWILHFSDCCSFYAGTFVFVIRLLVLLPVGVSACVHVCMCVCVMYSPLLCVQLPSKMKSMAEKGSLRWLNFDRSERRAQKNLIRWASVRKTRHEQISVYSEEHTWTWLEWGRSWGKRKW